MPRHLQPPGLYQVSTNTVASLLFSSCRSLDNNTLEEEFDDIKDESLLSSPRKTPKSPSKEEVLLQISPSHKPVLSWLSHLPDRVVEDVVRELLVRLETHLLEDMDNKLILTLINIEKMKINDFYFGLHSLFSIIQGFQLESLQFSKRLWYCLSQYGEITNCRHLTRTLCSAMPGLPGLTRLNVSHVATDQLCLAISRWLPALVSLDLSNSSVSDKAVRYLSGTGSLSQSGRPPPSVSAIRNLNSLLDLDSQEAAPPAQKVIQLPARAKNGCYRLEKLSLQSCEGVTERGIIVALEHLEQLHQLDYHQKFSMLEILIRWISNHDNSERMMKLFRLTDLEHGFPYSLSPLSSQLTDLSMLLPQLSCLTLVTTDDTAAQLVQFSRLQRITLELEDLLGEGFLELLTRLGPQLLEVNLSCSSDPEVPVSLDQVAGLAGQQAQLFNAALVAAGQLCPRITKLSITGCGLVSTAAVARLDLEALLGSPGLMRRTVEASNGGWFRDLSSLILMTYDDTHPTMTVHSGLLRSVLGAATSLRVLNLEGYFGTFINDAYFASILAANPLCQLKILDICVSDEGATSGRIPLSMSTVQAVLGSCVNIRELRISDWSVTGEQFRSLATSIKDNNWDLTVSRKSRL